MFVLFQIVRSENSPVAKLLNSFQYYKFFLFLNNFNNLPKYVMF